MDASEGVGAKQEQMTIRMSICTVYRVGETLWIHTSTILQPVWVGRLIDISS